MNILVIGASGVAGSAIYKLLAQKGHNVIAASRSSGDTTVDISNEQQLTEMWEEVGTVDAVVIAAGSVRYASFADLTEQDFENGWQQKALAQINVVRTGIHQLSSHGSFTLMSGIPSREPVIDGTVAATVNGALEAFVQSVAPEIAPRRINIISPSMFTESSERFGRYFPGFKSVALADVAMAYLKSIEGVATGKTIIP